MWLYCKWIHVKETPCVITLWNVINPSIFFCKEMYKHINGCISVSLCSSPPLTTGWEKGRLTVEHTSNCLCISPRSSAALWPRRNSKRNADWSGSPDGNSVSAVSAWRHDNSRSINETRQRQQQKLMGDKASATQGFELVKDLVCATPFGFNS